MMYTQKRLLLLILIIGGIAVLGSYAVGFLTHENAAEVLWGGVPDDIQPLYTVNMFLAAVGYLFFTYFIFFRLDPVETRILGRYGYGAFNFLYLAILIPSALWLPLTFFAIEKSSAALVWATRLDLFMVAAASLVLFFALLKLEPHQTAKAHKLAIIGCAFFCLQTVILDAIIWGSLFHV